MSQETIEWLNTNTMLGFTAHREKYAGQGWVQFNPDTGQNEAWWHRADFQNGYPDAIPVEEVQRVLFNWEPVETEVEHRVFVADANEADATTGDGRYFRRVVDTERKGIMHPETGHVFGIFGRESYKIHGYNEWLIDNVSKILDSDVGIASAGLLRNGGVAYVCVELPDCVETEAGMDIRPSIVAATSIDGTKATTYKTVTFVPICDNSLDASLHGEDGKLKIKHSARSLGRIGDARKALGLIYRHAENMVTFLDSLSNVDVTDAQFKAIVSQLVPVPDPEMGSGKEAGKVKNQRAITGAENRQAELWQLYGHDPRCAPWNGTLLGAYSAQNTWNNHFRSRSDIGIERVMKATLGGDIADTDALFFDIVKDLDISLPDLLIVGK